MNVLKTHLTTSGFLLLAASLGSGCTPAATCPPPPAATPPAPPAAATPVVLPIMNVAVESGAPSPAMLGQLPELPRPSPDAQAKQRVGVTDISIAYSSPAAKGRTIWGELVPYGKIWRTGANSPTKLTSSRPFTFGGKEVAAGTYSVFTIPAEAKWTVILNKDPQNKGAFEHDVQHDVARIEVAPATAPARERLAFTFDNTTDDKTELVLDWAGLRVAVPLTVNTEEHVAKGIAATLDNAWRPLFNAGRYAFDKGDHPRAIELLKQSIGVRATWWNHWWAAQVLAKQGQHKLAREHAQKATELGKDDAVFQRAFAEDVKKALASWPQG